MGYINLTKTKLPSTETHPKLRFTNNKHESVINDSLYFKRSHIKRQCIPFTKTKKEKKGKEKDLDPHRATTSLCYNIQVYPSQCLLSAEAERERERDWERERERERERGDCLS